MSVSRADLASDPSTSILDQDGTETLRETTPEYSMESISNEKNSDKMMQEAH